MSLQYHTFIDNTESIEESKDHLISYITLGKNYIHYSVMDANSKECLLTKALFNLKGIIGQSEFDTLLADNAVRNSNIVHIAVDTAKHTLVPSALLAKDHYESYFAPLFELEKEEEINAQEIDKEMTQLYVVKKATLLYLKNEFKEVHFYSNTACLLHSYLKVASIHIGQPQIFIHAGFSSFTITLFKDNKLHYLQSFEMIGDSDVLYCLLNVLQWHQIEMGSVGVYLTGFSDRQNQIAELLSNYFIVETIDYNSAKIERPYLQNFPIPILFNQYSLITCVL